MKQSGEKEFRKEWDFSNVPPGERKACFLYEAARESETIRKLAEGMKGYSYSTQSDQWEPSYLEIATRHNLLCARLLANIAPDLDLEKRRWQDLPEKMRLELGAFVANPPAFTKVHFDEMLWRERRKANHPDKPEVWGPDIVAFQIDWSRPLRTIEKDAVEWLRANPKADTGKAKGGRHAGEYTKYQDALRRLGALRLRARHPLKKAIGIAQACGVKLYAADIAGYGGKLNQTAWENAIKGFVSLFQQTFRLRNNEMPRSWHLLQKRWTKNRNPD